MSMAKKTTSPHRVRIERIFKIPAGAEEAFTTTGSDRFLTNDGSTGISNTAPAFLDMVGVGVTEHLQAPNVFSVIDQKLRRGPGGTIVVDIVIEVEDVSGANEYEAHVTVADL